MNKKNLWSEKINENKIKVSKIYCFSVNIFILIYIFFMNYIFIKVEILRIWENLNIIDLRFE